MSNINIISSCLYGKEQRVKFHKYIVLAFNHHFSQIEHSSFGTAEVQTTSSFDYHINIFLVIIPSNLNVSMLFNITAIDFNNLTK